jgi:hypothetical protein
VGERADRDEVDTEIGQRPDAAEGDATRGFQ